MADQETFFSEDTIGAADPAPVTTETASATPAAADTTVQAEVTPATTAEAAPASTEATPTEPATPTETPELPATTTTAHARKWAGRFDSPEQMEGYLLAMAEAQQRQAASRPAAQPGAEATRYTPEQIDTYLNQWMQEQAKAAAEGRVEDAIKASSQISLWTKEYRQAESANAEARASASNAYQQLVNEVQPLLQPYQDQVKPGTPLYGEAQRFFAQAKAAMAHGQSLYQVLSAASIFVAAHKLGLHTKGVATTAKRELTAAMAANLKQAAIAGGGTAAAAKPAQPSNFWDMSEKEFDEYESTNGLSRR